MAGYLFALHAANAASVRIVELLGLKRHVASRLSLTSETFSRTLRRLAEAGLIAEVDKDRLELLHPKRLRQVADRMFPNL